MPDQPRILVEHAGKSLDLLYVDFLSYPESDVDNIISVTTTWFEQITRKHQEMKRYLQMVKQLQNVERVEKDYEYLFQLRYLKHLGDHEDLDIQRFIQNLPLGAFLQVVFRLSLNDLRGIRYCHFNDLTVLLKSAEISWNQRHLRLVEKLPEYQQFLLEPPGPFPVPQSRKRPASLLDHDNESSAGPAASTAPSDAPTISPEPHNQASGRRAVTVRTPEEKQLLREVARQAISKHADRWLGDDEEVDIETAINYIKGGNKPGDICGAVVDRRSGQGYACISNRGSIMDEPRISTGPNEEGFHYFEIRDDQGFFMCGSAAVLYIYHK